MLYEHVLNKNYLFKNSFEILQNFPKFLPDFMIPNQMHETIWKTLHMSCYEVISILGVGKKWSFSFFTSPIIISESWNIAFQYQIC